jgi:hypothetical protein
MDFSEEDSNAFRSILAVRSQARIKLMESFDHQQSMSGQELQSDEERRYRMTNQNIAAPALCRD